MVASVGHSQSHCLSRYCRSRRVRSAGQLCLAQAKSLNKEICLSVKRLHSVLAAQINYPDYSLFLSTAQPGPFDKSGRSPRLNQRSSCDDPSVLIRSGCGWVTCLWLCRLRKLPPFSTSTWMRRTNQRGSPRNRATRRPVALSHLGET